MRSYGKRGSGRPELLRPDVIVSAARLEWLVWQAREVLTQTSDATLRPIGRDHGIVLTGEELRDLMLAGRELLRLRSKIS